MNSPNTLESAKQMREALYAAEVALRDQREHVAALRRKLPRDNPSEDYALEIWRDGEAHPLRLSGLFADPSKPLLLMHFMFGKAQESPCPMCTMWADGYAGVIDHLSQRTNFAVLVAGDLEAFASYAKERGWDDLTLVSASNSSIKTDLGFETPSGGKTPGVSVFERGTDDALTHFYSVCAFGPDGGRMMDLLSPVWNFFDLLPAGRGDWMPSKSYIG